jgi:hypothetical protein
MSGRAYERSGPAGRPSGLARRGPAPAAVLQRALGNRAMNQILARKGPKNRGTFEHSVRIGKLGPIEIKDSNIDAWIGGKADAEDLIVTTVQGKHSDELKRLSDSRTRVETLEVATVTGQNSWVTVTFHNAIIKGYTADADGKTEQWRAVRFDAVDIKRTSIGAPRP